MDQTETHIIRNIEETRKAMDTKIDMIINRIHHTIVGPKIAADHLIENLLHAQKAMQEAPSTTTNGDHPIHRAVGEAIERVKSCTYLIEQVKQDPWVMLGSALLMGYVLGSLNRGHILSPVYTRPEDQQCYSPPRRASAAMLP